MLKKGDTVKLNNRTIEIVKFLGKGKGGYSYLAISDNEEIVYKKIHYEPCEYYNFGNNKVLSEVEAYKRLSGIGIKIPRLLEYSEAEDFILKEYIVGPSAAEMLAKNELKEHHFAEVFSMANSLYTRNTNIDFFPTNFIYRGNEVYYIDYECNDLIEEWDFETWGIYFWLNQEGIKELVESGESSKLCLPNSPKPIKSNFEEIAIELIKKYSAKYK